MEGEIHCDNLFDIMIHTNTFNLQKTEALTGAIKRMKVDIVKWFVEEEMSISVSK